MTKRDENIATTKKERERMRTILPKKNSSIQKLWIIMKYFIRKVDKKRK